MLSHRATYELGLAERNDSGVTGARGLLVVAVERDCDAWHVTQGIALVLVQGEDQVTTVSDFDSREALDGSWYSFEERTSVQPGTEEVSTGKATLGPEGGTVRLTRPQAAEAPLPAGTLFPMAHLADVLAGARRGERMLGHLLFDGTEGLATYDVSTLVAPAVPSSEADLVAWPLRIAFFLHGSPSETPELEVSAHLRDDGVADRLVYDYGSFVISAKLTELEALVPPEC